MPGDGRGVIALPRRRPAPQIAAGADRRRGRPRRGLTFARVGPASGERGRGRAEGRPGRAGADIAALWRQPGRRDPAP